MSIWFDSNCFYGAIRDLSTLVEVAKTVIDHYQLEGIDTFLDGVRKHHSPSITMDYGYNTSDHTSSYSLRNYLEDGGMFNEFMNQWNEKL